jgi:hypothetical protein
MLQRMTRSSKESYREQRKRSSKICRETKREMLKRQIETVEVDRKGADTRKYSGTSNYGHSN